MIKYNEATECCVTNGAEAVVVGWKSHLIAEGRETLDTLFVKLVNPHPKTFSLMVASKCGSHLQACNVCPCEFAK